MKRTIDRSSENRTLGDLGPLLTRVGGIVAALGILATLALAFTADHGVERFFKSYTTNFAYFLSLSLGGIFFVVIQHLTGATWSVTVRRIAEAIAANMLLLLGLFIPIVFGMDIIYHHWTDPHAASDPVLAAKLGYLNKPFFLIRWGVYFLIWVVVSRFFHGQSVKQDTTGDIDHTLRMQKWSAPAIVLFALTTTFAAFDLIMSLNPHWYSTILGVYYFAGSALSAFALIAMSSMWLQAKGRITQSVTTEHYHDLGKLCFAFTIFWAYIGFSQFMLIWYANIPEETEWYLHRITGSWLPFSWGILIAHFVVPFLFFISRVPKRSRAFFRFGAAYILIIHWCDMYWVTMPEWYTDGIHFSLMDITLFFAMGGLYLVGMARGLGKASLVPEKDPRLEGSLAFENY